jgi:hypothetical protein
MAERKPTATRGPFCRISDRRQKWVLNLIYAVLGTFIDYRRSAQKAPLAPAIHEQTAILGFHLMHGPKKHKHEGPVKAGMYVDLDHAEPHRHTIRRGVPLIILVVSVGDDLGP